MTREKLSLPAGWLGYEPHDNDTICCNCPHEMRQHWTAEWACRADGCPCNRWGCPPDGRHG